MKFTWFPDVSGKEARLIDVPWSRFVDGLRRLPPQQVKEGALLKLGTFGELRTRKGSLRHDDNLRELTGIEGDYDAGEVSPVDAMGRLERHQLRAVVVTTWSHDPTAPRWRVFAPLARAARPSEHRRMVAGLNGALGGVLGSESFTLSRAYFVGGRPGWEYLVLPTFDDPEEGACLDEWEHLNAKAIDPAQEHRPAATLRGVDTPRGGRYVARAIELECARLAAAPKGARNESLNVAAFSLARFVADGSADAEPVVRALALAAAYTGLPEREIERTIESAFAAREVVL